MGQWRMQEGTQKINPRSEWKWKRKNTMWVSQKKTILRGALKALSFYIRKIRSQISNIMM